MKYVSLGGLDVSRIGLGAMTMAGYYTSGGGLDDDESIRTIHRALDLGITHIDTAEIYGPFHSEELVGRAIMDRRDRVVVATKFGFISHSGGGPGVIDSSPANVRAAVEGSLTRLHTDHIDLYYQHRVDPNTPIEDTVSGWPTSLLRARFCISACPRRAQTRSAAPTRSTWSLPCKPSTRCGAATPKPSCCRCCATWASASSLTRRSATGFSLGRSAPSTTSLKTTGARTTRASTGENFQRNLRIVDEVQAIATEANATPAQIALAWLLAQGDDITPIPGTRRVARVEENTAADGIGLSEDQLNRLNNLTPAAGERHDEANMATVDQ
jgi:aryl-alcohol dehydrogenase-like predicted oxidoreductase